MNQSTLSAANPIQSRDYEIVEIQDNPEHYYTVISQPESTVVKTDSPPANKLSNKLVKSKIVISVVIVVIIACFVLVLMVALVLYSPLVQTSAIVTTSQQDTAALLSRIEHLEETIQQLQPERMQQLQETQMTSVEPKLQQLANHDASMNTSLLNLSSHQNTLKEDIDLLRTANLYDSCFEETTSCDINTASNNGYGTCSTSFINIDPQDSRYFISNVWCDLSDTNYFAAHTYQKSGTNMWCNCEVTRPVNGIHGSFSLTATCTLSVTKCPRSINLLCA